MRPARACRESWQALPASCATVTPGNINPTAPTAEMKERQKHPAGKARVPDPRSHHMLGSSYHQSPTYRFHGHLCPLSQLEGLNDKGIISYSSIFLDTLSWGSHELNSSCPIWFTACFKIPRVYSPDYTLSITTSMWN